MNELKKTILKYSITFVSGFLLCFILFYTLSPSIGGYNRSEKALHEQFNTKIDDITRRNNSLREHIEQLESINSGLKDSNERLAERKSEFERIAEERADVIRDREASLERANARLRELESIISRQSINYKEAIGRTIGIGEGLDEIINELRELSGEQSGTD